MKECRDKYWFVCPDPEDQFRPDIRLPDYSMIMMLLIGYTEAEAASPPMLGYELPNYRVTDGNLCIGIDGKECKISDDQLYATISRSIEMTRKSTYYAHTDMPPALRGA